MVDYSKLEVVFADAEEKFAKKVVLYGSSGNDYVHSKKGTTEADRVDKDTLLELLKKGMVVVSYEGAFYTPVFFKDNTTSVELTIATAIATGASTAVVLNSKEYSEE